MRVVNCRKDKYTHYIGRGSAMGNPFTHLPLKHTKALVQAATVEQAVEWFHLWAEGDARWDRQIPPWMREELLKAVAALPEDAVLGCYCSPGQPCHGRVVIALAARLTAEKRVRN